MKDIKKQNKVSHFVDETTARSKKKKWFPTFNNISTIIMKKKLKSWPTSFYISTKCDPNS